jgi:hypothetical protein
VSTVYALQVPGVIAQDSQAPLHAESQQYPSVHAPDLHCDAALHVAPLNANPHLPPEHAVPAHCESLVQVVQTPDTHAWSDGHGFCVPHATQVCDAEHTCPSHCAFDEQLAQAPATHASPPVQSAFFVQLPQCPLVHASGDVQSVFVRHA